MNTYSPIIAAIPLFLLINYFLFSRIMFRKSEESIHRLINYWNTSRKSAQRKALNKIKIIHRIFGFDLGCILVSLILIALDLFTLKFKVSFISFAIVLFVTVFHIITMIIIVLMTKRSKPFNIPE